MSALTQYLLNYGLNGGGTTVKAIKPVPMGKMAEALAARGAQPLKHNAARIAQEQEANKGGFGPVAAALLGIKANAVDKYNLAAQQGNAQLAAQQARERELADRQSGWDREDAVDARKRGYAVDDREDQQAFDLGKFGAGLQNSITLKNMDQVFNRATQNANFEHDSRKQERQLRNDFEKSKIDRAMQRQELAAEIKNKNEARQAEALKYVGDKQDPNMYNALIDPFGYTAQGGEPGYNMPFLNKLPLIGKPLFTNMFGNKAAIVPKQTQLPQGINIEEIK
jgi:hypothetical protein